MPKQWLILVLAAVLMAGCTASAPVISETPVIASVVTTSTAEAPEISSQEPSPIGFQAPTLMEPSQAPAATVRLELEATDPDTVDLASGPTLVEFFAFW